MNSFNEIGPFFSTPSVVRGAFFFLTYARRFFPLAKGWLSSRGPARLPGVGWQAKVSACLFNVDRAPRSDNPVRQCVAIGLAFNTSQQLMIHQSAASLILDISYPLAFFS